MDPTLIFWQAATIWVATVAAAAVERVRSPRPSPTIRESGRPPRVTTSETAVVPWRNHLIIWANLGPGVGTVMITRTRRARPTTPSPARHPDDTP